MPLISTAGNSSGRGYGGRVRFQDGLTQDTAAPSAKYLYDVRGVRTSGDYWIKPTNFSGAAVKLFCDMSNQGGGWVLIGKGRQYDDASGGWFGTNNAYGDLSGLQQANSKSAGVVHVSAEFVNKLMNGTDNGWNNSNSSNYIIANRITDATDGYGSAGRSLYMKITNQSDFRWVNQFGSNAGSENITGSGTMNTYTGQWLNGSLEHSATQMIDFGANDCSRWFTWYWTGHGNFRGWSAGNGCTSGFQNASEQHAIQFVQMWAR